MRMDTKEKRAAYRKAMIPAGAVKDPRSGPAAEAYTYERGVQLYAIAFWGSAGKPTFHYRYSTVEQRTARLDEFFAGVESSAKFKAEQKEAKAAKPRGVEVGDVLHSQWGYDQTNNDYFECTKVLGKYKIEVRKIGAEYQETGWLSGRSVPIPGMYIGEPMTKIARDGAVRIASYTSAYVMKPESTVAGKRVYGSSYESSYA